MIVIDTNVVSELMGPSPDPGVMDWIARQAAPDLHLSAITEAELRYGAALLPKGRRRDGLLENIEGMLREDFGGRVIPFESYAAKAYAVIAAARRAAGRPISHADCQIAAVARALGASVATRDMGGFEGCGIEVINPWAAGKTMA